VITVKRFRLFLGEDSIFIHKGKLGFEELLLKWNNIQKITLRQSIYQRRHNLANVIMHTGGGTISIPFISLELAQRICNYSLYKIETDEEGWM
jgi:putative membrane protein